MYVPVPGTRYPHLFAVDLRRQFQSLGVVVAHALSEADEMPIVIKHNVVVSHNVRTEYAPHRLREVDPVYTTKHGKIKNSASRKRGNA